MKILLVRTSAMGDIVHALPALRAVRAAHPDATIGWVVEQTFLPLLAGHVDIDTLIPVRMRGWRQASTSGRTWREVRAAWRAIRSFGADVACDLMGNHKGGLLARSSGAPRVLGPARPARREPSSAVWIDEPVEVDPAGHAVDRMLGTVRPLVDDEQEADFDGDKILADARTIDVGVSSATGYVVVQAGAGWGNKQYPVAWWGKVARELREKRGVEVLVPVAPGEASLARGVADASDGAARTVDAVAFSKLAALLRGARLLLGGDTGPLHLAHALGTPVLCVMGPTDPRRNGPYAAIDQAVVHELPCSFCYKRFQDARPCLLRITPDEVVMRAQSMLDRDETPAPRTTSQPHSRATRKGA